VVPLTEPVEGPPVAGPVNAPPLLLDPEPLPELDPLLEPEPPLDPELELLPDPELLPELERPLGVHPGAGPAGNSMPLPSAMYVEQSGNVTFPLTIVNVAPL
jgi:hypothetical protein